MQSGIYEKVINRSVSAALVALDKARIHKAPFDKAEAADILSQYLAQVLKNELMLIEEKGGDAKAQIRLVNRLVAVLEEGSQSEGLDVTTEGETLLALLDAKDPLLALGKQAKDMPRPETSLALSSLFTGSAHEPQMYSELKKEIASADRVDMLVSFIKWSGLRLIIDDLDKFTRNGGRLRVITTSYMGATDLKAVDALQKLSNTEIRVSYNTKRTRLHAKAYIFYRDTGFSTAYIGSSNLSGAAISSGLEWNVKVTDQDMRSTMIKIGATFESYWASNEFAPYVETERERLAEALSSEHASTLDEKNIVFFDLRPYDYQQEILDRLKVERHVRGYHRNLIVAATGTGKTMIAAFDYRQFKQKDNRANLLFVAHRKEILDQSLATFRAVLRDANFGDLFVGQDKPKGLDLERIFISVQTLNSQKLWERLPADYYDYIIVDEFHHAAAPTYQKLLTVFKPKILLGLTATPERMDGKDILDYFDGRIAAEIRLPEAIDRKLLCPFQYFGVADTVDLSDVKWNRGGYDKNVLSNLYTLDRHIADNRAGYIIKTLNHYVTSVNDMKALAFCVSVEHARFMAEKFNQAGISALSLSGESEKTIRNDAKAKLVSGEINIICVVDLYNEGVDIPEINTVLFLRPTESLTVFLQQLGRGLRLADGKDCLTVLDYVGRANPRYNFKVKFKALLSNTRRSVTEEIKNGFVDVPKGCYVLLEKKAQDYILENIKKATNGKAAFVRRMRTFTEETGQPLTLANFLDYYHIDVRTFYKNDNSFSDCAVAAGAREAFDESAAPELRKAFIRFCAIDSGRWIIFLRDMLSRLNTFDFDKLSLYDARMVRMFYYTIWQEYISDFSDARFIENIRTLAQSPVMMEELLALLDYRFDAIDVEDDVIADFDIPLFVHCTYSRDQILVAMDYQTPKNIREGVKWLPNHRCDVLFVTLNKSEKDYSPTTMYHDYSINDTLFHWQSQSNTSENSPTGQRYIHHREQGSKVLLFVREYKKQNSVTMPYTFLGTVNYVSHTGSKPMSITWQLDTPIPAKTLKQTNQLITG
ncbi:MAG: DUF3427 domain-containing protein [Eubacteriaceae bacterium]|nr:DUF3427 domain-containing protein [Eubacteriaceae bacterium]